MPAPPFIPEHTRSHSFRRTTGFSVPTKTPARSSRSQRVSSPRRLGGTRSRIITTIGLLRIVDAALNASRHGVPQPGGQGVVGIEQAVERSICTLTHPLKQEGEVGQDPFEQPFLEEQVPH